MTSLTTFLHMGGYALYVWSSYGLVLGLLFWQWLVPWRQWKQRNDE